jgi:hypothetical protein
MTKAFLRKEILEENEYPYDFHFCFGKEDHTKKFWDQSFEYWIPEFSCGINDGSEYNMVLATELGFVLVNSIDFDFEGEYENA